MKILWMSNYPLPSISVELKLKTIVNEGWKIQLSEQITKEQATLNFAFPCDTIKKPIFGEIDDIRYIGFPVTRKRRQRQNIMNHEIQLISEILSQGNYDVIHIWGTEFLHSYTTVQAAKRLGIIDKIVISIQGIAAECALHYYSGVDIQYIKKQSLIDIIRNRGILKDALSMKERGYLETMTLCEVRNIIGRTEFDKRYVQLVNPKARYFNCNETLRECFYTNKWNYEECTRNTIFISQGTYPLKGLHYVLKALVIVKKVIPDVKLFIGGSDMIGLPKKSIMRRLFAEHPYPQFLNEIIDNGNIRENVFPLGQKNADEMKQLYLSSNIFVLPSNIENSPNSLGEAMLLGVPSIAANVGGVSSMSGNDIDALLYQHDDYYMLASRLIELLMDREKQEFLSRNAIVNATKRHDAEKNLHQMLSIYDEIYSNANEVSPKE